MDIDTSLQLDIEPGVRTPHVNGAMITLAREGLGFTVAELAARTGASTTSVGNWESGRKQPSHYLQKITQALAVTAEFLSMASTPSPTMGPNFRSQRSPEKVKAHATAYAQLQHVITNYLDRRVELGLQSLLPITEFTTPQQAARAARLDFGLGLGPVPNMIRVAERVAAVSFGPRRRVSIDAYSLIVGAFPLIVLTPKGDYYRQRWDVAHELGHLIMHRDAELESPELEAEANTFAAEFLIPEESIRPRLPRWVNDTELSEFGALKEVWGVSMSALVRRSNELGLMPDATFAHWADVREKKGWRRREPGLMERPEATELLPNALARYLSFGIPRSEIIRELGLPSEVFESVVSRFPVDVGSSLLHDSAPYAH